MVLAAVVLLLAREGAILVLATLAGEGIWLVAWLASATGVGALVLRGGGVKFNSTTLRWVAAAAIGLGIVSLIELAMGLAGAMSRGMAVALLVAGILIGLGQIVPYLRSVSRIHLVASASWIWIVCAAAAGVVVVASTLPPGLLWRDEPNAYDVVEYHLQVPREWFENGRITPLHHNVYSFLPFNVEMQYLLAMQLRGGAWRAMYLCHLMHAAMVALAAAAVYGVLTELGSAGAARGAVIFAATPWSMLLAPIAYNDGGLLLFGTLALGLALVAMQSPSRRTQMMALAGLSAGFACGAKLTAVPMILVAVPLAIVISQVRYSWPKIRLGKSLALPCTVFLAAGVASFSPWLIRNLAWTGNPVFPEGMSIFGRGHFSPTQQTRWEQAHSPRPDQRSFSARMRELQHQVIIDWRFGYLPIPLALAAFALMVRRRAAWMLMILLLLMMGIWVGFTHLQGRFLVLIIPICALLIGMVEAPRLQLPMTIGAAVASALGIGLVYSPLVQIDKQAPLNLLVATRQLDAFTPLDPMQLPDSAHVVLIGEARAFLYSVPTARLHYKTVFDVDAKTQESADDSWRAGTESLAPPVVEVIDPLELLRFSKTYYGIPPPSSEAAAHERSYVRWR